MWCNYLALFQCVLIGEIITLLHVTQTCFFHVLLKASGFLKYIFCNIIHLFPPFFSRSLLHVISSLKKELNILRIY